MLNIQIIATNNIVKENGSALKEGLIPFTCVDKRLQQLAVAVSQAILKEVAFVFPPNTIGR